MLKKISIITVLVIVVLALCGLAGCGSSNSNTTKVDDLKDLREISWDGTELTVAVGTNKGTGCEWSTKFDDDKIIDYSVNRKFKLSDEGVKQGQGVGTSYIGYKGKSAGTTKIQMYIEKERDGNAPGYEYTVTVTVAEDGTIVDATGE